MRETEDAPGSELGIIISFEGIDASGKNTQSRLLYDWLNTRFHAKAEYLSFPDYSTSTGQEIRNFLHGKREYNLEARHLLYSANRYELKETIEKWLYEKKIIVINRYCESNLAYGAANGLPLSWLEQVESRMPQANYIVYLMIAPEISRTRRTNRDRYEEDSAFLKRVSDIYDALAIPRKWITATADRPREIVHREIISKLTSLVPRLSAE